MVLSTCKDFCFVYTFCLIEYAFVRMTFGLYDNSFPLGRDYVDRKSSTAYSRVKVHSKGHERSEKNGYCRSVGVSYDGFLGSLYP
ncbi:MAG: hypothetical protein ACYS21_09985, partial [Planctomycetota bacterium]